MVTLQARDVLERARTLAADFATRAADHDRDGSFPFENFDALRDANLLNLTVPARYGGQGAGLPLVCRVIGEIARGDASTALVLAMHYIYHAMYARAANWPAGIHERLCRESIEGIALINVVRVEPELGTPARGGLPRTTAEPVANGWRLTGISCMPRAAPSCATFLRGRAPPVTTRASAASSCPTMLPACASSKPGTTSACVPPAAMT
jgi:alkylation response protein AidB-like acyl-CoA dehydrogenase